MTANLQAPNKHGCRSAAKIPTPKPNWTHDGEIIQKHTQMVRRLTLLLQSRTKFDICNAWAKTTWEILVKSGYPNAPTQNHNSICRYGLPPKPHEFWRAFPRLAGRNCETG